MTAPGVPEHDRLDFGPRTSDIAVVVPVINEGSRIQDQLLRMREVGHALDVMVADGGSTDGSLAPEFLEEVGVRTLLTKTGPGRLSAQLRMGFAAALDDGYSAVITVDGNGKDGVQAIPALARSLRGGMHFVQGSRFVPGGRATNTPWSRYAAIRLLHAPITSLAARRRFTDTTNGFRGHSAQLLSDARVSVFRDVFDTYELLAYLPIRAARLRYATAEVPVERSYPPGAVPTKIHSLSAQAELVTILLRASTGRYDP